MPPTYCEKCHDQIDDDLKNSNDKRSCTKCGSTQQGLRVEIHENIRVSDHFGFLAERNGKIVGFRESEREGRTAAADINDDGTPFYSITGTSPQGEEDTLSTCRNLILALNKTGANWNEPNLGDGVEDCIAANRNDPSKRISIQVVRAVVDDDLWKRLNLEGKYEDEESREEDLAKLLKKAIAKKANDHKIPTSIRRSLVLALDANRLPILSFTGVIEKYHDLYEEWTKKQGFREVWVVGPNDSLVKRLDTSK